VSKRGIPANRYLIYFFLAASGLAADLATKHWIFAWPELRQGGIHWLWENHVGFQISLNEGALFGFGQGLVWLYVAVALVAIVGILAWLFIYQAAQDLWLLFALGSITAGVLGNLYDRLGLPGEIWPPQSPRAGQAVHAVRDWILIQWSNQWRWPNFNIADSLLVIGAGIVLYHTLWLAPTPSKQ
jgi:signal peptidase II